MNILLINNNPVVSRLVSLCMRDETIHFEEVSSVAEVSQTAYDLLFVDDGLYNEVVAEFVNRGVCKKVVYLSSKESGEEIGEAFETVIKKPFLPSQICALIDDLPVDEEVLDEAHSGAAFLPLSETEERVNEESEEREPIALMEEAQEEVVADEEEMPLSVLDKREVAQIKELLEESDADEPVALNLDDEEEVIARKVEIITQRLEAEGLEIVNEEEIVESLDEKVSKKKKRKKKKKVLKLTGDELHQLINSLAKMKPKKVRKMLKGAKVKIAITFKES